MKVSKAATIWIDYHRVHSKENTVRSYKPIIDRFCLEFGDFEIDQVRGGLAIWLHPIRDGLGLVTSTIRRLD